jgi:quercetin dioxygenase-like cupin family protein
MALQHASPGEIVDLSNLSHLAADTPSTALFKTTEVEVIRRVLHQGQTVPQHQVEGPLILHCLTGKVKVSTVDGEPVLAAGQLTYLLAGQPYGLEAQEDSALLMTIVRLTGQ